MQNFPCIKIRKKNMILQFGTLGILISMFFIRYIKKIDNVENYVVPKIPSGGRVVEVLNGQHFDEILQETPYELRPSSFIFFYDSSLRICLGQLGYYQELSETIFPPRENVFLGKYDFKAVKERTWYDFVSEMDLKDRFGVEDCSVVFISKNCHGDNEWKVHSDNHTVGTISGSNYCREHVKIFNGSNLTDWVFENIEDVKLGEKFRTQQEQRNWLIARDKTTFDNQLRNLYFPKHIKQYTKSGVKLTQIPKELNEWLLGFYDRNKDKPEYEKWSDDATHMSYNEQKTKFYNLDNEFDAKEHYVNTYLKPILEKWSNKTLKLTAFYGIREYHDGDWLKPHIDRIDTHVISATISLKKLDLQKSSKYPWPLRVVDHFGKHVQFNHEEGTMILYESASVVHGRPERNKGGGHLGCFVHFAPIDDDGLRVAINQARYEKQKAIVHEPYKYTEMNVIKLYK